jgi:uncharacterized protein YbjT (DUF2867 family)
MPKTKVLILGAGGAIAQHVIEFLQKKNIDLSLFARNGEQLERFKSFTHIFEGDATNQNDLDKAIKGQEIIYANLAGSLDKMAKQIVESMNNNRAKRLIFVTSLGIYNEIPGAFGKWNDRMIGSALKTYRRAADIIEASNLDYTLVRPAWLTNNNEVSYELTQKGEPFKGTEVSRKSVAAFIADVIEHPEKFVKASVGVNKPGTEGDKPSFY